MVLICVLPQVALWGKGKVLIQQVKTPCGQNSRSYYLLN